jgi:NDP-sugar pyrophosphorylase family protein
MTHRYTLRNELNRQPVVAVLLAAGHGRRLRPLTNDRPKCLLRFRGRPLIDYALDALLEADIRHVYIVTHHLSEQVEAHITRTAERGLAVTCVRQSGTGGTADALQACREEIDHLCSAGAFILVSATDYALPVTYFRHLSDFHLLHNDPISVSVRPIGAEHVEESSLAILRGSTLVKIMEKPALIYPPPYLAASLLYIVPISIFEQLVVTPSPRGEHELSDVINGMIGSGLSARYCLQSELPTLALDDLRA